MLIVTYMYILLKFVCIVYITDVEGQ